MFIPNIEEVEIHLVGYQYVFHKVSPLPNSVIDRTDGAKAAVRNQTLNGKVWLTPLLSRLYMNGVLDVGWDERTKATVSLLGRLKLLKGIFLGLIRSFMNIRSQHDHQLKIRSLNTLEKIIKAFVDIIVEAVYYTSALIVSFATNIILT
ncbi:hypothetical protein LENED_007839 [Lentinula edodes]|uniref:Uncharacterized protein n=1 Tax=Lentinula edodes TaxID=5353 RepID=A0A1Q3EFK9_LENED|nr:hypothetical protein LENED_007839 [Lentinula edodes]